LSLIDADSSSSTSPRNAIAARWSPSSDRSISSVMSIPKRSLLAAVVQIAFQALAFLVGHGNNA
jgi:hypothetical protein